MYPSGPEMVITLAPNSVALVAAPQATETGDRHCLAFNIDIFCLQHLVNEVQTAETGGFRTNQRTAEFKSFSGECSRKLTGQLLVHTEHITYFASSYADITGGNIHIRTQMTPQLQHERLAETHDFSVALAAW